MVAVAFAPGAVVADAARQAIICSSLIYRLQPEIGEHVTIAPLNWPRRHRAELRPISR